MLGTTRIWPTTLTIVLLAAGRLFSPPAIHAQPTSGKCYALLVGVQAYQHVKLREPDPLKYPVADVTDLASELTKHAYTVVLLTDKTGAQNQKLVPTRENIERELKAILRKAGEQDTVLVGLAGHGLQFTGKKDAYFCPIDARPFANETKTLVSITAVYEELERSFAGVKVVFVDACRNDPDPTRGRGLDADSAPPPPKGVGVLFSCSAGQRAFENDELKHGVFFHYVLAGLKGGAQDDTGEITFENLSQYVRKRVPAKVRELTKGTSQQLPNVKADLAGEPPVLARITVPGPGESITTSLGMELALIPAGRFRMGSPALEKGRSADEAQVDVVLTQSFYLGKTEVTQGQWRAVMGTTPWKDKTYVKEGDNYAATYVSWEDARAFCKKLSEKERVAYRLPTEAEWEYACRGGRTTRFSFGDEESGLGDHAWFGKNAFDIGEKYAHEVGRKQPNPFGLHDMHGNVWEWCEDVYADKLPGGTDPLVSAEGSDRVHRGGGWSSEATDCRSAVRGGSSPVNRLNDLGFRVARVPGSRERRPGGACRRPPLRCRSGRRSDSVQAGLNSEQIVMYSDGLPIL